MTVAERMAPISASDGSAPPDRICSIVAMGHAKHARPSKSVDQAHTSVMLRPRHPKNAAAATATAPALAKESPFPASQAPIVTTRLPNATLMEIIQDEGIAIRESGVAVPPVPRLAGARTMPYV